MRKISITPTTVFLAAIVLLNASPTKAAVVQFDAFPFTGDSAQVSLTLDDAASGVPTGDIKFTVDVVPNPNIGDIRGVFFNILTNSLLSDLSIAGADVTLPVVISAGSVTSTGGGNNINPEGPFDIGVEIGTSGIGSDDIQSTMFVVSHGTLSLSLSEFTTDTDPGPPNELLFAVRLTSVGLPAGSRNGSSKLGATENGPPVSAVPEPGTLLLIGSGLVGLGAGARRRKKF